MLRTITVAEKNLIPIPANAIVIPDSQSTEVVKDYSKSYQGEIAAIAIQNVGVNNAYVAFGQTADNVSNYHKLLVPYADLNVPCACQVQVFSPGGTTIAVTILKREGL